MRVTFVLPFFSRRPIGGLRAVYEFASGLARRDHDVTVIHPRKLPGVSPPRTVRAKLAMRIDRLVAVRGVPWLKVHRNVALKHVSHVSNDTVPDADAVFATSWQTAGPVSILAERKGRKHYLVMDFYPYLESKETLESTWRLGFRIATISRWLADMVINSGISAANVAAVSCGVSAVHRLTVPIEDRETSIVMMYGMANYKAASDALSAIALVRSEYGAIPVRLFGPNFSRRPRELPEWAEYYPLLSDQSVSDLYNKSAVFVSSSMAEGFCLPAAEAMASGCAVVATDSGGIRDFALNGSNALLSEPGRPIELARNIMKVLRDRNLRLQLASKGLDTMSGRTWDYAVDQLEKFLLHPADIVAQEP